MPDAKVYKINLPVKFSQFDPQWAKKLLGFNTDPQFDFYNFGCLVSSLANVCRYYGYDEDPSSLNDKLKGVGGFKEGSGLYVFGSITKIYPDIKEERIDTPEKLTDEQIGKIKEALDNGFPVMVKIDYDPKTVKPDDHFSLFVDYDVNDENNFILADTLGGVFRSLKSYLAWFKPSARDTIERFVIYTKDGFSPVKVGSPTVPVSVVNSNPSSGLPENYPDIVHGSSQWDSVVSKFGNGKVPKEVSFSEVDSNIQKRIDEVKGSSVEKPVVVTDSHAGSQWNQTVEYLELGKLPSDAVFEDVKRVIAGFKSAKTDYDNKRIEAEKQSSSKDILIKNKDEMISSLEKKVLRLEKLHKAELDALIKSQPNVTRLKVSYDGVLKELQKELDLALSSVGNLRLEVSDMKIEKGEVSSVSVKINNDPLMVIGQPIEKVFGVVSSILGLVLRKNKS